jgi:redox-sensing transcriptional repressor
MKEKQVSKSSVRRIPVYLEYLRELVTKQGSAAYISATAISLALHLGEVQVRKDLASICSIGKPKIGYLTLDLIRELEDFLGYNNVNEAVLVGAGKLGKALLNYQGFNQYGLRIVAAFDIDEKVIGKTPEGKNIFHISKLKQYVQKFGIKMGIITVPAQHAQSVCNLMIESDILAIWNFANTSLKSRKNILIHDENMAVSLAVLSNHLKKCLSTYQKIGGRKK